jgi:hypothetical protein
VRAARHRCQVPKRPRPLEGAARPEASATHQAYTGSGVRCIAIGTDRRSFAGFAPTLHEAARISLQRCRPGDRHVEFIASAHGGLTAEPA